MSIDAHAVTARPRDPSLNRPSTTVDAIAKVANLGRDPLDVELRDPHKTPVYQLIAAEAAAMRESGIRVSAIARRFKVDRHTADKALRWFHQR